LTKQIATKLENGTISSVSNKTLGKIMMSGAPSDAVGSFTTSYVRTKLNNLNLGNLQNYKTAVSVVAPNVSLTIGLAQASIQLARSVIAGHQQQSY
jgi:hypothetical protein